MNGSNDRANHKLNSNIFLCNYLYIANLLIKFLGVDYLHARLTNLGYPNIRIRHRFDGGCKELEHVTTNAVSFYDENLNLLFSQKQEVSKKIFTHKTCIVTYTHIVDNDFCVQKRASTCLFHIMHNC